MECLLGWNNFSNFNLFSISSLKKEKGFNQKLYHEVFFNLKIELKIKIGEVNTQFKSYFLTFCLPISATFEADHKAYEIYQKTATFYACLQYFAQA